MQAVTGQKIDHFAEVNLAGFYYLAQAFGGIEVCIKPYSGDANLHDDNSGFNAVLDGYNVSKGGAQYLHLSAPQALAFVRERDNLPNGDLDRTHRQQAVLDYVIWKLENSGALSDLGQLTSLLNTAKQYLITDSTWNLLDFATDMHALTGKNLQFYTAPIAGYATIDGQSANQVDIPTIQAAIKAKFTAPAADGEVAEHGEVGCEGRARPARFDRHRGRVQRRDDARPGHRRLRRRWSPRATRRARSPTRRRSRRPCTPGTQVFYGSGASANAAKIADYFGATAVSLSVAGRRPRRGTPRHRVHRGARRPVVGVGHPGRLRDLVRVDLGGNNGAAGRRCHRQRQGEVRHSLRVLTRRWAGFRRMVKLIAGKAVYAAGLPGAAICWWWPATRTRWSARRPRSAKGITDQRQPAVGAMNILVMGLESRTNYQGQTLPNSLLTAMHAGNASSVSAGQVGSQDTNTLILIHIFAGGRGRSASRFRVTTWSPTRSYDGQTEGKIDGAYAYAYVST